MDGESRNLQNDFFNDARKARTIVSVYLNNGKKLTGRIKSFDKFTLLLDGHHGEMIVFKHAVSTVSVGGGRGAAEGNGPGNGPAGGPGGGPGNGPGGGPAAGDRQRS